MFNTITTISVSNFLIFLLKRIFKFNFKALVGLPYRANDTGSSVLHSNCRQAGLGGIILLVLMLFSINSGNAAWTPLNSGTNEEIWGIHFINANTGWLVGANGVIRKTTDGGNVWNAQGSFSQTLRGVYMRDNNNGVICGHEGYLLNTTNSGSTWNLTTGQDSYYGMDSWNNLNSICVGESKYYAKTTNGGANWSYGNFFIVENSYPFDLYGIEYFNSTTAFDVTFTPAGSGMKHAVIHIPTNDCDEGDFDFAVKGTGIGTIELNISAIIEGYYNAPTNLQNRSDTFKVYLQSDISPFNAIDSAYGIIDSITHEGTFSFVNVSAGNYYIRLVHRNSIETWSASPQNVPATTSYDFTTAVTQSYGNNMKQVDASPIRFSIYSGDVNQDGIIDISDNQLIDNDSYNFVSGYVSTDINGDEELIYRMRLLWIIMRLILSGR